MTTTSREEHERVMALFDALCDLAPAEQRDRLASLAHEDAALAAELASLLAHDHATEKRLDLAANGAAKLLASLAPPPPLRSRAEATRSIDRVGQLVADRWRIVGAIGEGGNASVWRAVARDAADPHPEVALKFLQVEKDALAERRFRREYLAVSRLRHPGCVRVFAEGLHDGARYIAMEYVRGGDLGRFVGAPANRWLPLLAEVCDALDHVHRLGIVHRDLKPANVLVGVVGDETQERVRLADFGIAKLLGESLSTLSVRGLLTGTIDFVSPEQVLGHSVSPASDLFSLGCVLHFLLRGAPPFSGTTFERLSLRVAHDAPPLPPAIAPRDVAQLVAWLLAREPKDRPSSAAVVAAELRRL